MKGERGRSNTREGCRYNASAEYVIFKLEAAGQMDMFVVGLWRGVCFSNGLFFW